ncbi:MAG: hypothetical protein QGF00_25275 [Planctomycetota bacterium]|jgi:hypothetical protein|nr:hypothetical protein [Planctomycetota bacterium]MDP7252940.1 hypothetical protein [Planctomycetota bacterium]
MKNSKGSTGHNCLALPFVGDFQIVILLAPLCLCLFAEEKQTGNLLPNSSFEVSQVAREIYPIVGDYRDHGEGIWQIDTKTAWHGKHSLRMRGVRPFFWQVLNSDSLQNVFSVHLKGTEDNQEVEVGVEMLSFIDDGRVIVEGRKKAVVKLTRDWKRHTVASAERAGRRKFVRWHLYRCWVRPLEDSPLWVDAAQLEQDRLEPSDYRSERAGNETPRQVNIGLNRKFVGGPADSPRWSHGHSQRPKQGTVKLTVVETEGIPRDEEPVWGGVPFPKGELFDAAGLSLKDEEGNSVPFQSRSLARRHIDGSITSVLIDFQASVPAKASRDFRLEYGGEDREWKRPIASDREGAIRIDTGSLETEISKKSFRLFDSLRVNGKALSSSSREGSHAVDIGGRVFSSPGAPRQVPSDSPPNDTPSVQVLQNGPLHAEILVRAKHWAEGDSLLTYELRVHAFRGKPWLLIDYTFENQHRQFHTPVKSIFLRLPLPSSEGEKTAVEFERLDDKPIACSLSAGQDTTFTQVHEYFGRGRYDLIFDNPDGVQRFKDSRASGILKAGGSRVQVHDFWQLNPKALRVSQSHVDVFHWPDSHVRFADLPFGMSNTMRILYEPVAGEAAPGLARSPLLLQPDQQWLIRSGVFGNFLTSKETAAEYPGYHNRAESYFRGLVHERKMSDLTGMFDYGDMGMPGNWMNNETDVARNLFMQYFRTFDPGLYRRALLMVRHLRDVDVCHIQPGTRFMHHPSAGIHTVYAWHTGHFWTTGLIWHYLLTGDSRTYEVVKDVGAELILKHRNSRYVGRERTRILYHLAELYDLTHLHCFRDAFERHYNFGKPTLTSDYGGGLGLLLLKRWYDVTGEQKYLDRFRKDAEMLLSKREEQKYFEPAGGRGNYIFSAMAEAANTFDDRKFVDAFLDEFLTYLVSIHGVDVNTVRGAEFLAAARRFGIGEQRLMPERLLGLDIFTGYRKLGESEESRFRIRLTKSDVQSPLLKIYRTRNFRSRLKKAHEDSIEYSLVRVAGTKGKHEMLTGVDPQFRAIEMDKKYPAGTYELVLTSTRDGQAAVSASGCKVLLNAEGYFHFRRSRSGTAVSRFAFRAPEKNELSLKLKWPGFPGQGTGLWLQDEKGSVVSSTRWMVPIGTEFDEKGRALENVSNLPLAIPDEARGKILTLTITGSKWMGWKLDGLDYPWFGVDADDF